MRKDFFFFKKRVRSSILVGKERGSGGEKVKRLKVQGVVGEGRLTENSVKKGRSAEASGQVVHTWTGCIGHVLRSKYSS